MTRRSMFFRMVLSSILRRRSRVFIAILAVAIGGTTLSGLATIAIDVPAQMAREVRSYGANLVVTPGEDSSALADADLESVAERVESEALIGYAAFDYETVVVNDQPYVGAGIDFEAAKTVNPFWYIDGDWPQGSGQVLIGEEIASTIGVTVGDQIDVSLLNATSQSGSAAIDTSKPLKGDAAAPGMDIFTGTSGSGECAHDHEAAQSGNTEKHSDHAGHGNHAGHDAHAGHSGHGDHPGHGDHAAHGEHADHSGHAGHDTHADHSDHVGHGDDTGHGETRESSSSMTQTTHASANADTPATVTLTVSGILKTGGNDDQYLFMGYSDMSTLTGQQPHYSLAEYSVALEGEQLAGLVDSINTQVDGVHAQTVKRLAQSDTGVLEMLRSLLLIVTVIVLALTIIGVSTTMVAVVTERRNEIGLRKALGATSTSIVWEFIGEGVVLGLIGGIIGAALGFGLAALVSLNVFHRTIAVNPLIIIVTILASVAVSVIACLSPVRRAAAVDPALVLRGE
ncbi:FtsX-like permease family protein [Schaalia sp. ZJ1691]|uniref:FtsX-like permease family protein n=1 Tax=Schaalia sp. ZJ1691 TaxID=2709404 RepID=UPI001F1572DE|nr:FtsX-like permease family protein [Schaalia sp. ZJ1691]